MATVLAGDIIVFNQLGNEPCHLFGRAFAVQGMRCSRFNFFCCSLMFAWKRGRMTPGADTINADVVIGKLARQRASELRKAL